MNRPRRPTWCGELADPGGGEAYNDLQLGYPCQNSGKLSSNN